MNKVLASVSFGLLILTVQMQYGHAQSIDPLIDSPGNTIGSDFNGDGIHDFIVGAYANNDGGAGDSGAAYIFFGASNLSGTKSLGGVNSADVTILGKPLLERLGQNVSGAGDLNGDGFDDFVVGAPLNDDGVGANNNGAAYIFFGSATLSGTKSLGGGQSADVTILGKGATDTLGSPVSAAGDVNGDGFDDMIVGAYGNNDGAGKAGAAYIFFGSSSLTGTKSLGGADSADVTFLGKASNDYLGISVSGAGDVNGDGFDDMIVGAFRNNDGGSNNEGAVYIFFGSTTLSGTFDMGGGVQSADVTIFGKATTDQLGVSVSGVGDVNGDGFDDIIVGADRNNDGGTDDEGVAYIFLGASNLSGTKRLGGVDSADVTILGKTANDYLGRIVSGAGDINDDGFDDVIVGARGNSDGGSNNEGAAYIFYGSATLSGTKDTGTADEDVRILGKGVLDYLGRSLSGIGDVNADGFPDIVVGANRNNDGGSNDEGAAYIIFGASNLSGTKSLGGVDSADVTILGKASGDFLGFSVGGGRSNPGP